MTCSLPSATPCATASPFAAGSDSHTRFEIGSAYMEIEDFKTPAQLLKNLKTRRAGGPQDEHPLPGHQRVAIGRAKVMAGHRGRMRSRAKRTTRINVKRIWMDY